MEELELAITIISEFTGASRAQVMGALDQLQRKCISCKPRGRPSKPARKDYDKLSKIDFASMTELDELTRPLARRLLTVDALLRRTGISEVELGDRTQVKAAGRLTSQFARAVKKEVASVGPQSSRPVVRPKKNAERAGYSR